MLVLEELEHATPPRGQHLRGTDGLRHDGRCLPRHRQPSRRPRRHRLHQGGAGRQRANPADIGYINAHGTSTQVNDRVETACDQEGLWRAGLPGADQQQQEHARPSDCRSRGGRADHQHRGDASELLPPTINYEVPDPSAISITCRIRPARSMFARAEQQLWFRRAEYFLGCESVFRIANCVERHFEAEPVPLLPRAEG